MFKELTKLLLTPQYDVNLPLEYSSVYGPYLKKNPISVSEPFYTYIFGKARSYVSKTSRVLDAGCGLGRLTIDVANNGPKEVIGIDANAAVIFEANAIAHNHRQNLLTYPARKNTYTFLTADIQDLPFPNDHFSLALCINVVDRIANPQKAVNELYRVLSPQGVLLLSDPYHWVKGITPPENQVNNLKDLLPPNTWTMLYEEDNIPFAIQVTPRRRIHYQNHLLILKKNK